MSISSTNPLSGSVVEEGAVLTIVSTTPLQTILYRREGYSDETIYASSAYATGYTGAVSHVTNYSYIFRRNVGWDVSPFQIITDDGSTESTIEFYIVSAGHALL